MSQQPDLNKTIDKIENALHELSLNPKGGWTELMKMWGTPYYGNIPGVLRKRGIAEPEGTGLKWVGDKPTRTLAGIVYEEAKEASQGVRSKFKSKNVEAKISPREVDEAIATASGAMAYWPSEPKQETTKERVNGALPSEQTLARALAVMEKAMRHQVADPVAFTLDVLKDGRI